MLESGFLAQASHMLITITDVDRCLLWVASETFFFVVN